MAPINLDSRNLRAKQCRTRCRIQSLPPASPQDSFSALAAIGQPPNAAHSATNPRIRILMIPPTTVTQAQPEGESNRGHAKAALERLAIVANQEAGNSLSVALSKRFSTPRAFDK